MSWPTSILAAMPAATPDPEPMSARVRAAQDQARHRRESRNNRFGPVGGIVMVVVLATTLAGHPAPGLSGKPLLVLIGLIAYLAAMGVTILDPRPSSSRSQRITAAITLGAVGAAGIVLAAAQPSGASEMPGSAAVIVAYLRYDTAVATAFAAPLTVGLAVAVAGPEHGDTSAVVATVVLCIVLAVAASLANTARRSQDQAELLLAELEDAREAEAGAAAASERARIAGELHDVLAHSLSGLSIQLQLARKLGQREGISPELADVIDRAGILTREGLVEARRAVGALQGGALPTVEQLPSLVETYDRDMGLTVCLRIEGPPRPLPADASLALYRGAQEALTNAARYAPASAVTVGLRYDREVVLLAVEDVVPGGAGSAGMAGLAGGGASGIVGGGGGLAGSAGIVGGGRGLAGMKERIGRAGGTVQAGPTPTGWLVRVTMPA